MFYISVKGTPDSSVFPWFFQIFKVKILLIREFNFFDICKSFSLTYNEELFLLYLDASNNFITFLRSKCFTYHQNLVLLNISNNFIKVIEELTFINLKNMKAVDLSNNKLTYITLRMFQGLENIIYFRFYDNPLKHLEKDIFLTYNFILLILTDDFRICCTDMPKDIFCTALPQWPAICEDIMSDAFISISMWIILSLIIFLNFFSLKVIKCSYVRDRNSNSSFEIVATYLLFSDIICGIYLTFIATANIYFKGSFAVRELYWRGHIACYIASFLYTFFQLTSIAVILFMALARLHITLYPLTSRFRYISFTSKGLAIIVTQLFILSVLVSVLHIYYSTSHLLPNSLCNVFYDPFRNDIVLLSALLLSSVQLLSSVSVIIIYFLILYHIEKAIKRCTTYGNTLSSKKAILQIVLITGSSLTSWTTSGIIFILSVLIQQFPTRLLVYNTIFATPSSSLTNSLFVLTIRGKKS